ncbi:hypothetical protein C7M22_03708 [Bacillus velezensis]|uniref:hypothetical protein n=1 Tax=Bacillus amyloliquefaciens group TaxID=1938374 RepID=UPI0008DBE16D|nr:MULTISPECIES: hypothetical protein [Bacillus amyloliquefaciens group]APA02816.1 hypothetical protein BK055_09810 [Bacillus velezensis]MEC0403240.1 hypothetical protein [Bacillus velezensis]QHK65750.1 hypothetical protein C7M22_03708 [Bacillus velezensis]QHL98516.1 hypothetical protein C7M25_02742 [Bacillus velezensis]WJN56460.1 hypothetical protein QTN52_09190 [Bacillus velezensis]
MNTEEIRKKIQEYYNNLSREELINQLESSGFEVTDSKLDSGNIILDDYDEFTLKENLTQKKRNDNYTFNTQNEYSDWKINDSFALEVA